MIGCSFVVDREYFGEIGLLDPGMEVYGGENIELGMRVSRVLSEGIFVISLFAFVNIIILSFSRDKEVSALLILFI